MSLGQLFLSVLPSCCCSGSAVRKWLLKFNYIGFCFSHRMEFFWSLYFSIKRLFFLPVFSFCFQLCLCLSSPVVSNVCNCGICSTQRPWFLAVNKEGFCTRLSWAGNALVPSPDSKSGCSVICLCQQFRAVRIEIGDNRAEGKLQSSPRATTPESCFSI